MASVSRLPCSFGHYRTSVISSSQQIHHGGLTFASSARPAARLGLRRVQVSTGGAGPSPLDPPTSTASSTSLQGASQLNSSSTSQLNGAVSQSQQPDVAKAYDTDIFHYKRWWCQRPSIIGAGILFIVGSNILTEPGLKTTLLAAAPVALWWYIFLWVLPQQFKEFAVHYIAEHPECVKHDQDERN